MKEQVDELQIIGAKIENFMKISLVEVELKGRDLVLSGKNGAGKSSVIHAIWAALEGKDGSVREPIKKGAKSGKITLNLGKYTVVRSYTESNGPSGALTVKTSEGAKFSNPQEILSKLFGMISIDPHRFMAKTDKEQLEALMQIAPLDIDLDDLAQKGKAIYQERTDINRELKQVESSISQMGEVEEVEPVEVSVLMEDLNAAQERELDFKSLTMTRQELDSNKVSVDLSISEAKERLQDLESRRSVIIEERDDITVKIDAFVQPEIDPIKAKLASADETNAKARKWEDHQTATVRANALRVKSEGKTNELDSIEKQRNDAIGRAAIPVKEIGIGDGFITYNDTPFKQASHAQQVVSSLHLLMSQNPALKIVTITDASLMDGDSWDAVKAESKKHGFQIISEHVANCADDMQLIISDGSEGLFLDGQEVAEK